MISAGRREWRRREAQARNYRGSMDCSIARRPRPQSFEALDPYSRIFLCDEQSECREQIDDFTPIVGKGFRQTLGKSDGAVMNGIDSVSRHD
jgi:hypothetical protein